MSKSIYEKQLEYIELIDNEIIDIKSIDNQINNNLKIGL